MDRLDARVGGSTTKAFPTQEEEQALDHLLQGSSFLKQSNTLEESKDLDQDKELCGSAIEKPEEIQKVPNIKREDSESELDPFVSGIPKLEEDVRTDVKKEEHSEPLPIVFKKRKFKSIRQK